jgi:hypothetical protein
MDGESINLRKLVGENISARIPAYKDGKMVTLKLLGVDIGGIWAESQEFMEEMLAGTPHTMTPRSLVFFLPYAQILAIYVVVDSPWISKKVAE